MDCGNKDHSIFHGYTNPKNILQDLTNVLCSPKNGSFTWKHTKTEYFDNYQDIVDNKATCFCLHRNGQELKLIQPSLSNNGKNNNFFIDVHYKKPWQRYYWFKEDDYAQDWLPIEYWITIMGEHSCNITLMGDAGLDGYLYNLTNIHLGHGNIENLI